VLGHWNVVELVRALALNLLVMVMSLSVHECAHAWVASLLGDDTAKREGRLSLSPVTHTDLWGTLIIPSLGVLLSSFGFIGWARPTPVSPHRFRRGVNMGTGMALVAAAGPISNLVLAVLSLALIAVLSRSGVRFTGALGGVGILLVTLFHINVGLMIFNLLPFPPLDGSRLLPRSTDRLQAAIAPYSFFLLIIVLNVPILTEWCVAAPVRNVAGFLQSLMGTPAVVGLFK
jgi:Zn-dependent protease